MNIAIVGAGEVGSTIGGLLAKAGHDVTFSWSRDERKLRSLVAKTPRARSGSPREAIEQSGVVVFSPRFEHVHEALAAAGDIGTRVFIDTCNPYTPDRDWRLVDLGTKNESEYMRDLVPTARYVKAFNTLTAGFQREAAGRSGSSRVVMFLSGDDVLAKRLVADLIFDCGFDPYDLGAVADSAAQQPGGRFYGEEFHLGQLPPHEVN